MTHKKSRNPVKCPECLPAIYIQNEKFGKTLLTRKLAALDFIVTALDSKEDRVSRHIYRSLGRIDWKSLDQQVWNENERLALQWMKTIWSEKMHVMEAQYHGIWPSDHDLRESIFCALAEDAYLTYLIDKYHRDNLLQLPKSTDLNLDRGLSEEVSNAS